MNIKSNKKKNYLDNSLICRCSIVERKSAFDRVKVRILQRGGQHTGRLRVDLGQQSLGRVKQLRHLHSRPSLTEDDPLVVVPHSARHVAIASDLAELPLGEYLDHSAAIFGADGHVHTIRDSRSCRREHS